MREYKERSVSIVVFSRTDFKERGFTLIELMIVIAILAILAVVAVGIYRHYFRTAFEVDPVSVLMSASAAMEDYYADHGTYPSQIEDLPGFDDGSKDNEYIIHNDRDPRRKFKIYIASANATAYSLKVENYATSEDWKIVWSLNCTAGAPVGSCKPVQEKGSGILRKLF
ncbi:type IV pilus assembly protein PilE [Thermosulfidibacter takaii ABI70S6]|uniref:Type IV pilus assembly protein PilE n=1 Tax=Thermosulfidibacter takaii (strain DSM 17441 / JCM 13301 / NBRC 103674 / ABI70S6) TaxID=1298851 RepID=A0A0S3QUV0_THET7|nr:prepilin-type N-terminal cleavage/methylation domain-containing protein [Thermosulfidibacter takaii]BAT72074.1 type IV pilus assembly protein PilE [Thermosulfidibacter takaii ABI70S6]